MDYHQPSLLVGEAQFHILRFMRAQWSIYLVCGISIDVHQLPGYIEDYFLTTSVERKHILLIALSSCSIVVPNPKIEPCWYPTFRQYDSLCISQQFNYSGFLPVGAQISSRHMISNNVQSNNNLHEPLSNYKRVGAYRRRCNFPLISIFGILFLTSVTTFSKSFLFEM